MKARWITVLVLAVLLLSAVGVSVPAKAADDPATTGRNAPIDFAASTTQVCPVCGGDAVQWQPLPQITSATVLAAGHYYVPDGGVANTAQYTFNNNGTRCIHLNGSTLTSTTRLFNVTNNARIRIFGSGDVTANTKQLVSDGAIMYLSTARIYLYGGNYSIATGTSFYLSGSNSKLFLYDGAAISGGKVTAAGTGANIHMLNGAFTMYGGSITGGQAVDGGNVYIKAGTFKMSGGTVGNGVATNGGNIFVNGGTVNLVSGEITGGSAASGGNIYAVTDFTLDGCTVSDGQATGNGGNIAIVGASSSAKASCGIAEGTLISGGKAKNGGSIYMSQATVNFTGGEVTGGTSTNAGGCFDLTTGATLNLSGGTISDGTASGNGGNIYSASTNSRFTMTGGTVSGGTTNNSGTGTGGGNIFINNGYLTMTGGTISGGKAPKAYGGNIYTRAGINNVNNKVIINDDGDPETPKPLITGGVSKYTGGNIYINGDRYDDQWSYITLGDCEIVGGDSTSYTYGDDISLQHSGQLTLLSNFSATADIYIPTCCLPAVMMGGAVDATAIVAEGAFSGTLTLEQFAEKYQLMAKEGSTRAYICDTGIQKADGSFLWLKDNTQIIAAAKETDTAVILVNSGEVVLDGGEYVIDLRGNNVHFSGTGTVKLIDSVNDTFANFGTATTEGVTINTGLTEVGENRYYTICEDGTYSAHRLAYNLIKVSLRTSVGGIYYTAKWECDETLAKHINAFGVAVSVLDMPEDDFSTDGNSMWSVFEQSEFENGVEKTGVMITGILKDINADRIGKNAQYGKLPIFAAAYVTIDGNTSVSNGMAYSLHDVMQIIEEQINVYYSKASLMQSFMAKWAPNGLSGEDWTFTFTPSEDAVRLNELYAGRTAYHGELHDHADTGGKSDGKASLSKIKEYMDARNIDFTTILDHYQILHMELDDWDSSLFIGGSEFGTIIHDKNITGNKPHVNMLFSSPEEFKELMALHNPGGKYDGGKFTFHLDEASGNEYYDEHQWSVAEFTQLIEDIRTCGGMYVFPHPKDGTRYISDDPLDYWFADWVGLEVFYGPSYYAPTHARTANAYKLWTDLLAAGKKLWATAGSDSHNVPNTNALTTIYSTQKNAVEHFEHAKQGDMTCGPVGIRMCVGDTVTGGETSFTDQRMSICVGDFHPSVVFADHTYSVRVIAGKNGEETIVYTQNVDPQTPFYYGADADADCDYYRVEVYDESDTRIIENLPIAIGNPIWNTK